jgi:phosphoglycerate dehydrogenase-like enzyme
MSKFTVLIADPFSPLSVEKLKNEGFNVVFDDKMKDEKLAEAIESIRPTVLVVGSAKVPKQYMNDSLKIVIRAGSGYDTIDWKGFSYFFFFAFCNRCS